MKYASTLLIISVGSVLLANAAPTQLALPNKSIKGVPQALNIGDIHPSGDIEKGAKIPAPLINSPVSGAPLQPPASAVAGQSEGIGQLKIRDMMPRPPVVHGPGVIVIPPTPPPSHPPSNNHRSPRRT